MFLYCVSARNVTMGVFPDMQTATKAVAASDPGAFLLEDGDCHRTWWSPTERTILTAVAVRYTATGSPMF